MANPARVQAAATLAAGFLACPVWWQAFNARARRRKGNVERFEEALSQDAIALLDQIEADLDPNP